MTPTDLEIKAALAMVAVALVLVHWFRKSEAAHSTLRMMRMMRRFSLDPRLITNGNPHIQATLNETRRRCGRCRVEGVCERWLTGKAKGENTFCPNARIFLFLRHTGAGGG